MSETKQSTFAKPSTLAEELAQLKEEMARLQDKNAKLQKQADTYKTKASQMEERLRSMWNLTGPTRTQVMYVATCPSMERQKLYIVDTIKSERGIPELLIELNKTQTAGNMFRIVSTKKCYNADTVSIMFWDVYGRFSSDVGENHICLGLDKILEGLDSAICSHSNCIEDIADCYEELYESQFDNASEDE